MALISYSEFLHLRSTEESSASTRAKTAAALGLGPDVADVFGHATPPPWQVERLLKKLEKGKKKKKDKKDDEILEKHENRPDYSFDQLVHKASSVASDIEKDIEKGDKQADELDAKIKKKKSEKLLSKNSEKKSSKNPFAKSPNKPEIKSDRKPEEVPDLSKRNHNSGQNTDDELTEEQVWLKLLET